MRADTERAGISVSAPVLTRDGLVPVARFLLDCAAAIAGTPTDEQLAFVHAGRRALLAAQRWVQFEQVLTHRPETWRYVELRDLATRLLGDGLVTEFFFMHKPPGLRFRFEPAAGRRDELIAAVRAWHGQDVARMSCYEPETALFGGPVAMHHVHRLFTVDSLLWLDHHIDPAEPAWAYSLSVLAALLSADGFPRGAAPVGGAGRAGRPAVRRCDGPRVRGPVPARRPAGQPRDRRAAARVPADRGEARVEPARQDRADQQARADQAGRGHLSGLLDVLRSRIR